jgi:hypothetical protein
MEKIANQLSSCSPRRGACGSSTSHPASELDPIEKIVSPGLALLTTLRYMNLGF